MRQRRYLQVFEHETIYTRENESGRYLSTTQFDQLCAYNETHGNKYFTVVRQGVKFAQYVGVIQIGRTTIEILPKTDKGNDTTRWHNVLLRMLAECKKIKREFVEQAILKKRENSILDLYVEMYLDEVENIVRKGFIKQYQRDQRQSGALKGKLIFATHLQKNLVHKARFFSEHTIYTTDNLYNQIIKAGLGVVSRLNCQTFLKDRAAGLNLFFHTVSDNHRINNQTFQRLPTVRNAERYQEALPIARILLLNYSPGIKSGNENLLAILFNMNDLWEEYIYRQLIKNKPEDTEILPQRRKKFWESKVIKPDIILKRDNKTFALDTKWKVLDQTSPSDADLKQMFAYNIYWNSYQSILLYPKTPSSPAHTYGRYHQGMNHTHGCTLGFIDLLDSEGRLRRDCADQVWNIISKSVAHQGIAGVSETPVWSK